MKIYCFGNEFIEGDTLAKELVDDIQIAGVQFIRANAPEVLFEEVGKIFILDVVKGIDKLMIINDIDQLKAQTLYSLHDFDLAYFLKIMKTTGAITDVTIFGLPMQGDKEQLRKELTEKIKEKL